MFCRYEDYSSGPSRTERDKKTSEIRQSDCNGREEINLTLPTENAHKYHKLTDETGLGRRLRPDLKQKISDYVRQGIVKPQPVQQLLEKEVELMAQHVPATDRAYHPLARDVQNYIRAALVQGEYSSLDEENLAAKIENW